MCWVRLGFDGQECLTTPIFVATPLHTQSVHTYYVHTYVRMYGSEPKKLWMNFMTLQIESTYVWPYIL